MSSPRTNGYHARFHDLMSKIERAGIDLTVLSQRQNFARSILAILPQIPGAYPGEASTRSQYQRIMHTLGSAIKGKQATFNQATEAAIRAGLAYHIASDAVKTEATLAPKPKKSKPNIAPHSPGEKPIDLQYLIPEAEAEPVVEVELRRNRVPVRDFNWTVRERLMMAFMANDQEEFLAALREVK